MEMEEVNQLRTVTQAGAIVDLKDGRVKSPLAWIVIDLALLIGLHVSETAALKIKDIDLNRGEVRQSG